MQPLIRRYATLIINTLNAGGGLPAQAGDDFALKLVAYLKKRGHMSLLPSIVRRVERAGTMSGAPRVMLARTDDAKKFSEGIASALSSLNVDAGKYQVIVDESLVGGYTVRGAGKLVDRSYRTALVTLYQKITN